MLQRVLYLQSGLLLHHLYIKQRSPKYHYRHQHGMCVQCRILGYFSTDLPQFLHCLLRGMQYLQPGEPLPHLRRPKRESFRRDRLHLQRRIPGHWHSIYRWVLLAVPCRVYRLLYQRNLHRLYCSK